MRNLILGYFGTRNLGDQIMLREVIDSLPEEDEVFYMWGGEPLMFDPGRAKLVSQPHPPYDRVLFTVGGFWSYSAVRGKLGNTPLIGVGVDVGALQNYPIYNDFDVIATRNDISYQKLSKVLTCPVIPATDVVFGMDIRKENHEREGIGVCYSAHYSDPLETARTLKCLVAKTGKKVELIPMSYEKRANLAARVGGHVGEPFDWRGSVQIQKLMKNDVVVKPLPKTISEAVSRIQHYEAIISMRLHAGYLAALTGIPFTMCTGDRVHAGKFEDASALCTGKTLSLKELVTNFEIRPVDKKLVDERIANKVNRIVVRTTKETLNQKLGWAREAQRQ